MCKFVRKSVISCVLFVSVKGWSLLWAEKIPSEYWNNKILLMSLKTRFCSWLFQVTKSSLTNFYCFNKLNLLMSVKAWFFSWFFQISKSSLNNFYCFIIHAFISQWKKEIPGKLLIHQKELDSVCIVCSDKVTTLLCAEKIPSEYWNNKNFVNEFENTVLLVVLPRYQKLINQFLFF